MSSMYYCMLTFQVRFRELHYTKTDDSIGNKIPIKINISIGRKLKLRLFRNGTELPWLDYDDHYDFDYQQNKPLVEEKVLFPADHLIYGNKPQRVFSPTIVNFLSISYMKCYRMYL
jgi:hypothetical protein